MLNVGNVVHAEVEHNLVPDVELHILEHPMVRYLYCAVSDHGFKKYCFLFKHFPKRNKAKKSVKSIFLKHPVFFFKNIMLKILVYFLQNIPPFL